MQISVTQQDIDEGCLIDCYFCPIARALTRHTGKRWSVSGGFATVIVYGRVESVQLPKEASEFVRNFDCHGRSAVAPFSFEFDWQEQ